MDLLRAPDLARPHGVIWLDDTTLVVANRESELLLIDVTAPSDHRAAVIGTRVLVDGTSPVPVHSPGSVAARWITGDLVEMVVCNNYAHDVTRYIVDRSDDWKVVDADRLLAASLEIPDGVAISASGEWIAISNHNHNNVHLYRYDEHLGPDTQPDGVLTGPNYPHGLAFAADDRCLLLADAGLPYVHAYEALDGDWSGRRAPVATTRVMDDDSFNGARYNPQEGGPKGLEITTDDVVIVTSERQPLGFFPLAHIVGHEIPRRIHAGRDVRHVTEGASDPASLAFTRLARRVQSAEAELQGAGGLRERTVPRKSRRSPPRSKYCEEQLDAQPGGSGPSERAGIRRDGACRASRRSVQREPSLTAMQSYSALPTRRPPSAALVEQLRAQVADLQGSGRPAASEHVVESHRPAPSGIGCGEKPAGG